MGEESEASAGSDLADPPADEDREDGEPQETPSDGESADAEPAADADGDTSESDADGDTSESDADGDTSESDADGDTSESDADGDSSESDADGDSSESDADGDSSESGAAGEDASETADDASQPTRFRRRQHVQRRRQRASVTSAVNDDGGDGEDEATGSTDDSDDSTEPTDDSDDSTEPTDDSDGAADVDSEPATDGADESDDAGDDADEHDASDDTEHDEDYVPPWEQSELADDPVSDPDQYDAGDWADEDATADDGSDDDPAVVGAGMGADVESGSDAGSESDADAGAGSAADAEAESDDDEDYVPPWEQPTEATTPTAGAEPPAADAADTADADGPPAEVSPGAYADDDFLEGPESDQEMPLAEHIEEMVKRLSVVLLFGGTITLLLFPGGELVDPYVSVDILSATDVINYLWNTHIPNAPELPDRRPRVYGPLELILTELKVAALAGFVVSLPVFVYETYLFMRPGLYHRERRYYLAAVPTSLVLALVGVAFAHFVVLPAIFAYFTSYTVGTAVIAFGLKETFNLILVLMGYMALVFQIPLFIMLAIMMGLVTREWLTEKRLLFWGGFLGVAFLVSPDPTGMAPIIVAATMIGLFEGTLALLKWTGN